MCDSSLGFKITEVRFEENRSYIFIKLNPIFESIQSSKECYHSLEPDCQGAAIIVVKQSYILTKAKVVRNYLKAYWENYSQQECFRI